MLDIDKITGFYVRALDGMELRQRVIGHNIANSNTPNFRAKRVRFEETLSEALQSGKDVRGIDYRIEDSRGTPRADGNNVDLEFEWFLMERTRLLHSLFTRALGGTFRTLFKAIRSQ